MKANVIVHRTGLNLYTQQWLKYMAEWSGMDKEDVELISLCSSYDFGLLLKDRTRSKRIVGGVQSFFDKLCSWYSDIVVIGEGFQFFKDFKEGGWKAVEGAPYVKIHGREGKKIEPSYYINWAQAPIFKVRENKEMILGGRGCHRKCKFCFTSWVTKHQERPVLQYRPHLNIITNDSRAYLNNRATNRSITVKDYLKMNTYQAKLCHTYRLGIEAFTERQRKAWGKPITNKELSKVIQLSKILNHQIELFIIAGAEPQEAIEEFVNAIGVDTDYKPVIFMKFTYLEPLLHTPLENYDLRKLHTWKKEYIRGMLGNNRRIRKILIRKDPGPSLLSSMMRRARTPDEFETLWKMFKKSASREEVEKIIESQGWQHLWNKAPETDIVGLQR